MEPHQYSEQIQGDKRRILRDGPLNGPEVLWQVCEVEVRPSKKSLPIIVGQGFYYVQFIRLCYTFNVNVATHSTCTV